MPKSSNEDSQSLISSMQGVACHMCGAPMRKVSWKITAGAFDAGKEVEQTVYQCDSDANFLSIEVSTGNPSEFAVDYADDIPEEDSYL